MTLVLLHYFLQAYVHFSTGKFSNYYFFPVYWSSLANVHLQKCQKKIKMKFSGSNLRIVKLDEAKAQSSNRHFIVFLAIFKNKIKNKIK